MILIVAIKKIPENLSRNQLLLSAVLKVSTRKGKVVYDEAVLNDLRSIDDNDIVPGSTPQENVRTNETKKHTNQGGKKGTSLITILKVPLGH